MARGSAGASRVAKGFLPPSRHQLGLFMDLRSPDALSSLSSIERQIRNLSDVLGAPARNLPTFGESRHDGTPHIEVGKSYDFVVCEGGSEFERRSTTDLDELLYWVFATITFSMACDFEVRHRRAGEDFRRQLFSKQVALLAALSPDWGAREEAEHARILEQNPFVDE